MVADEEIFLNVYIIIIHLFIHSSILGQGGSGTYPAWVRWSQSGKIHPGPENMQGIMGQCSVNSGRSWLLASFWEETR